MSVISSNKNKLNPSRIIGIQFSVLSPEEIRNSSVAHITSRDTYINNKPVIGGLFDPRMGVLDPGLICPTDGQNYMKTPGYFGHIELARPVFYIQYIETIKKILRCICIKCSKLKICKEKYKFVLKYPSKKRWDYIFKIAQKIRRCGEDHEYGCGCKQPKKIYKQDLASIFAEWEESDGVIDDTGNNPSKPTIRLMPEDVLKIFKRVSDEDVNFMGFSSTWSRPDWFICQVLAVPPPAVRPSVKHDAQQRSEDDISHIIVNIIKANTTLAEKMAKNHNAKVIEDWTTVLQYYIATMVDNKIPGVASVAQRSGRALKSVKERLVGKQGRVRGNLMGKRVDYSARSVIGPDPILKISELGVPIKIAMNITFPQVVNKRNKKFLTSLMENGPEKYPGANILEKKNGGTISLKYVLRETQTLEEGDILHRHMLNGDPVLFNRQPSLHRMSMMCHKAKIMKKGNTFRMNVADTKPYNADFDGDEMNLHGPQDEESQAELLHLAAVPTQIISPANNSAIVGVFQDSLLGAHRFTRESVNFDIRTTMNLLMYFDNPQMNKFEKKKKISGFDLLSQIMPPLSLKFKNSLFSSEENPKKSNNVIEVVNGEYKRGSLDKGSLGSMSKGFLQRIYNDFSHKHSENFIDNLQAIVTEYMKLSSYSVGISDLISNKKTEDNITKEINAKKNDVNSLINQLHIGVFENNSGKTNEVEFETKVNGLMTAADSAARKIGRKNLDKSNRFVTMVNAGSKGSNINIAQMISCVGQQSVDGKRIPYGYIDRTLPHYNKYDDSPEARGFVESSFIQGLTPEEVYFHAMGGRTGLIDTAVKTSQTGYIQRRLIKGLEDLKVGYDMTVRNNKNKIIQFTYGDDSIVTTKTEKQNFPIIRKTLEEIYEHFQIPDTSDLNNISFTKTTLKKLNKQKKELINKTKNVIDNIVNSRQNIVENVFNYEDDCNIYVPVHFERIINNIKNRLHIKKTFFIDITPLDVYKLFDNAFDYLTNYSNQAKPNELFQLLWSWNLSPSVLLIKHRFNKKGILLLIEELIYNYKKAIVHPGEMVGLIAAQSIGEPTTQMTLNTFHFAGVASKSNVTRGVPRIEEILSLSENPKQPSVTIRLKPQDEMNQSKALELKYTLEYTCLKDVTNSVSICFDPKINQTRIKEDEILLQQFLEFEQLLTECGIEKDKEDIVFSKWIIRIELSKEKMLEKGINTDDIHFAIKNSLKPTTAVKCIFSDFNSDNLIFRIRLQEFPINKNKKSIDQTDNIYKLKQVQQTILNNIILRGVKNIPKVILRKKPNTLRLEDGNYKPKTVWVLDTIGTNLVDILALDTIDYTKTISNDIQEVYKVLGIEAARQSIHNELMDGFDGRYINYHHTSMLCDRMTATKKMVSIFRHGINNDDIGPIAKASFEETPEMFLKAAKHAELDLMTGVSANIMCGQEGYFGTGCFQILLNQEEFYNLEEKYIDKDTNIDNDLLTDNDYCSNTNIIINNTLDTTNQTGELDDDYDIDF
tara:strand:+ start:114 stop:4604 length:4491 start_codon:yes stop_codon:yes gene_type:complete